MIGRGPGTFAQNLCYYRLHPNGGKLAALVEYVSQWRML